MSGTEIVNWVRSVSSDELPFVSEVLLLAATASRHALTRQALLGLIEVAENPEADELSVVRLWNDVNTTTKHGDPVELTNLNTAAEAQEMLKGA